MANLDIGDGGGSCSPWDGKPCSSSSPPFWTRRGLSPRTAAWLGFCSPCWPRALDPKLFSYASSPSFTMFKLDPHRIDQARTSGISEIPTAMLTSPYIDFLVDPDLFMHFRQAEANSRNIRFMHISSIVCGGFVGGGLYRAGISFAVLWTAVGIKVMVIIWVVLLDR